MVLNYYCQHCNANCCRNWTIFTTIEDVNRIAKITGKEPLAFSEFSKIPTWEFKRYSNKGKFHFYRLAKSGFILQLKKNNNCCIFLNKNKCKIYRVRPYICRLYPFWFLYRKNHFEIIVCIGRNVCPIPDDVLNSFMNENNEELLAMAEIYYQEMQNYKLKIKNFVKKYFNKNVPPI